MSIESKEYGDGQSVDNTISRNENRLWKYRKKWMMLQMLGRPTWVMHGMTGRTTNQCMMPGRSGKTTNQWKMHEKSGRTTNKWSEICWSILVKDTFSHSRA